MLKLLYILLISAVLAYGSDKVEIYATSMQTHGDIVQAFGEVTVVYRDYFLSADEAKYNKETGTLELFGNIRASHGDNYKILGKYAKLNIADKERVFQPFFMLEKSSKVWVSADEGCAEDKDIEIKSGIMSGCNPNNPLWKMEFTSSEYNTETKWLSLYNARIYIYDIPVFYTPYFGYSLDTTRRTGLLTPGLGISDKEGFYYEQSLYIAEQNWWDLELKPQIRTNRGYGGYSTFRFVDSKISWGEFTAGYFKERQDYFYAEELVNDTHYGFNFEYDNSNFINQWFGFDLEGQSALFVDIKNMNDVDYINLATNDTTKTATATQVLSRINMFYNTDRNYYGAYFKYYKDLTKESNRDTLQKLPTFQYHYYLDTFLQDNFLYTLDIQSNNIYRDINKKVIQTNFNLPVTMQTSLFDEYLNIAYTAQLYAQHSSFSGNEKISTGTYNNGIFARNYNIFELSSQLTRAYEKQTHVIGLTAKYTSAGSDYKNGFYEDNEVYCSDINNLNEPICEFYNITNVDEKLELEFSQYLFGVNAKQTLYHKLAQVIDYKNSANAVGELENELDYSVTENINFYNNVFYNYDEHSFSKIFNKISYNAHGFNIALSHLYKDTFLKATQTYSPFTSYVTSSARYTYDEHYSYQIKFNYDLQTNQKKSSEIGFMYKKRCWDFGLRYLENNRPVLTQNNESSIYDRYLYFSIVLKPLMTAGGGTSNFAVRLPEALKGN